MGKALRGLACRQNQPGVLRKSNEMLRRRGAYVKFEYSNNQQTPQSERAHRIQLSTVIQSICCLCYHTIAFSASLDVRGHISAPNGIVC